MLPVLRHDVRAARVEPSGVIKIDYDNNDPAAARPLVPPTRLLSVPDKRKTQLASHGT